MVSNCQILNFYASAFLSDKPQLLILMIKLIKHVKVYILKFVANMSGMRFIVYACCC